MQVVVLGTGGADGVPQPFCDCRGCSHARSIGEVRTCSGLLIDGWLLIDAPPALGAAAARAGVDLRAVNTLAVTHAHPDHWDPAVLLHHAWQFPQRPLRIIGPPEVIAQARHWLPPDRGDVFIEAHGGGVVDLGRLRLRVIPSTHGRNGEDPLAAETVLYDIDDGSHRVLYAADTGLPDERLLQAVTDRDYHLALLELTFADTGPSTPGHLDHRTFPMMLAELQRVGAVGAETDVVAVHIGHHNPPTPELAGLLRRWGARCVPDGTALRPGAREPHVVLVTGGARSGKSTYVEQRAARSGGTVTYIATGWGLGEDEGWNARVSEHRARRPQQWRTVETVELPAALGDVSAGETVIIDCLSAWVTRIVDDADGWTDRARATEAVARATSDLLEALRNTAAQEVLVVTNEVGSGVVPATAAGGQFRDLLGRVNTALSAQADECVLVVAGRALVLPAAQAGGSAGSDASAAKLEESTMDDPTIATWAEQL